MGLFIIKQIIESTGLPYTISGYDLIVDFKGRTSPQPLTSSYINSN